MAINSCTPSNIYGPFEHTLFLGLSVRDFSCQAGWNDQFNTLTVTLVEDNCTGYREYFDTDFNWVNGELADPGFNYAPLGSPALFKIGEVKDDSGDIIFDGFEFGGIIQSYNVQDSPEGFNIVTVNMISPGTLLQGTNFIVGEYAHPINVPGNPNYPQNVQNLINVYGYLETLGYSCIDFNSPADPFGPGLGAPGARFGGAQKTSAGTPWTLIKNAIQVLCGGQYNGDLRNDGNFNFNSVPGTLKYIAGVGTYGSIPTDQYILDISELPGEIAGYGGSNDPDGGGAADPTLNLSNNQYRIQGPIISALDLINQIAEDAGMDYIISLMPTKAVGYPSSSNTKTGANGPVTNVIKVRVAPRIDVPDSVTLGSINNFIDYASGNNILIDSSVGQELVIENNAAYIVGGQRQDLFQVYEEDSAQQGQGYWEWTGDTWERRYAPDSGRIYPFLGYQPEVPNTCLVTAGVTATKYLEPIPVVWGQDFNLSISSYEAGSTCANYHEDFTHQWFFQFDYNKLPLNIYVDLVEVDFPYDPESLLCAALGDFESFLEWFVVYMLDPTLDEPLSDLYRTWEVKETALVYYFKTVLDALFPASASRPYEILNRMRSRPPGSLTFSPGYEDTRLTYKSFGTNESFTQRNYDLFFQDMSTIYDYLNKIATEYYGKAFNVEIPGLCFYVDPETQEVTFSDEPATDGAWVDTFWSFNCGAGDEANFGDPAYYPNCISGGTTGIMGMQHPAQTEFFMDDQGKLPAIIKFDPYKSYGRVQEVYETNVSRGGPADIQEYGPPNFFKGGNLGDKAWREQPFGFSSLGFKPFTPLYVAGEVESVWNIFKKPTFADDNCSGVGPVCSISAVVKLPERVSLAPSLGFRYSTFGEVPDAEGITRPVQKYVPDFPFFGIPDELVNRLGNNFRLGTWFGDGVFDSEDYGDLIYTPESSYFRDIVGSYVGSILKSTAVSVGNFPFALPCNAVVPVKSNTRTYGPWYNQGYTDENNPIYANLIQGKIHTEKDDSAVPWEFGGTLYLYQGMQAKINNLIMKMQNAERGAVTVAGYPQHELGTSLYERPSYINNHNEPNTARGIPRDLEQGSFTTLNDGIKYFYYIDTYPSGQPLTQITDMSVSVGSQGIQTTYTLSAYTPFKNRFTKTNYQRIKDQGLSRFKQRREVITSSRSGPRGKFRIDTEVEGQLKFFPGTSFAARSAPALFIGQYLPDNPPAGPPPEGVINNKNWVAGNVSRKEVASQTLSQVKQLDAYDDFALMSMDGLIRPVRNRESLGAFNEINRQNNGSGLGPKLPITNDTGNFYANLDPFSISGWEGDGPNPYNRIAPVNSGVLKPPSYARVVDQQNSAEPMAPLNGGTSKSFFPRPEINAEFLNFLANPASDLVNRGRGNEPLSGTFGHDIEVVARSSGNRIIDKNAGYISLLSTGLEVGYTEDYRFMAMRGPLMVHGWGYDLQGKPIPNSNETGVFSGQWDVTVNQSDFSSTTGWLDESYWTSGSPFSGQHRKDYNLLTDQFYSGWLQQPETWPAGPIDLRWDRQRSVWTVPNTYEFAFVDLETGIGGFASGDGFVRNYTDMYDAAGEPIFTDVTVVNPFEDEIPAQSIIAFYSKRFGTWFPIQYCCGTTTPTPPPPPPPPPTGCFDCNGQGACFWECVNGEWQQQGECPASANCNCIPPGNCNNCPGDFEGKVAAGICIKPSCDDVRDDCNGDGQGGANDDNPPGDDGGTPTPIINYTVGNEASFSGIALSTYTTNEFNTYSTKPLRGRLQTNLTSYGPQSTGWGFVELYNGYETVFSGPYAAATGSGLVTSCIGFGYTDDPNCPPSGGRDNYKYALVMNNGICGHLPSGADVNIQFDKQYGLFSIVDYNCKSSEEVTADGDILFYEHTKADATSADIVLTLPDATGAFIPGKSYYVKKVDATSNTVTVTGSSSQLIDGQSSYVMNNQYEAIKLVACGTGWMIF
jgi:hypothetical protein